jgi:hypothetical protein
MGFSGPTGKYVYEPEAWLIEGPYEVGQIRIEITSTRFIHKDADRNNEHYMLAETGIGTGALHYARDLFATRVAAMVECERRSREAMGNRVQEEPE